MLIKSQVNAAWPLAEKLTAKGLVLRAIPDTPLAELVDSSLLHQQVDMLVTKNSDVESGDVVANLIDSSKFVDPSGKADHDDMMEQSVRALSRVVERNLDLTQNVVKPAIERVVELTTKYIDDAGQSYLTPVSVVPFYYPDIWQDQSLEDLVNFAREQPARDITLNLTIPQPEDLVGALSTGMGRFDQDIREWVETVGLDFVAGMWNSLFGKTGTGSLLPLIRGQYAEANRALAAFLFSRRLLSDIPEGLDMDLSSYRAYMSGIMQQSALMVARAISGRSNDVRLKRLIISMPPTGAETGTILVNGDVYDQWLAEGGSPEILFGSFFSDRQINYGVLLSEKDRYLREWKGTFALLQSKSASVRFDALVDGLRSATLTVISEIPEEYRVVDESVYRERLRERMKRVKLKDLSEIWHTARKIVCRVIFPDTEAERILNAIDAVCKENPDMDIREAALFSVIDWLTCWAIDLFNLESV